MGPPPPARLKTLVPFRALMAIAFNSAARLRRSSARYERWQAVDAATFVGRHCGLRLLLKMRLPLLAVVFARRVLITLVGLRVTLMIPRLVLFARERLLLLRRREARL